MSWKKCRWDSKTCFFFLWLFCFSASMFFFFICSLFFFVYVESRYMNHVLFRAWEMYKFVGHWGLALNLLFQWERSKIGWIVLDNPCFWSMKKHLDSMRPTWKVTNATKRGLFRIVEVLASLGSLGNQWLSLLLFQLTTISLFATTVNIVLNGRCSVWSKLFVFPSRTHGDGSKPLWYHILVDEHPASAG